MRYNILQHAAGKKETPAGTKNVQSVTTGVNSARIKVKQMILIIVVSAVVYLVVGAMAPFIKYKEVSSQAGDSFRPEDFRQRGNGHGTGP